MASVAKFPFYALIKGSSYVRLQMIKANFPAATATELGVVEGTGTTGEPPTSATLIGQGRTTALENGCFGLALYYNKTATKVQMAKVLCAPSKADTAIANLKGEKYGAFTISKVMIPRRRVYVI